MKLSVTSWSFPQCIFKEAVGLSTLLDINAIDIGYFYRPALDKEPYNYWRLKKYNVACH